MLRAVILIVDYVFILRCVPSHDHIIILRCLSSYLRIRSFHHATFGYDSITLRWFSIAIITLINLNAATVGLHFTYFVLLHYVTLVLR